MIRNLPHNSVTNDYLQKQAMTQGQIQDFGKGGVYVTILSILKRGVFTHAHVTFFPSL